MCDECVRPTGDQDGDPYCGWCTLEKVCTRFKECKSSSWLPSNTAQCIQITDVEPPFVHYTEEHVKVKLTVEQLPPLNANQNYSCKFGDFVSPGLKDGKTITCTSPPKTQVPQIPNKEAAVEVSLSVHSSQTDVDFVTTQFRFYDCSAITSCSECVTSFTCDWCLYGNTCTQNAPAFCNADDQVILNGNATVTPAPGGMQGYGSCPQIIRQTNEELIHASLVKEVRIPVKNLPNVPIDYECVLTIEGKTSNIPASVEKPNITCSQYTYDYVADEQELTANIQIVWNNSNFIDNIYQVTLYKCSVQRPDCSRCHSNNTTRPQLNCVWCGDRCVYDSFCSKNISDCPAPVITQVIPLSVATVMNQPEPDYTEVIELVGTDFGQTSSDIASIMIDSKECEKTADGFNIASQT
ncbi:plexin-A4-like, partial [Anneissia japonica]|uniref:plexin-A4-like n=1 Tax=Anneissia japonica TaxID=1529436 RepID=UPI00142575F9